MNTRALVTASLFFVVGISFAGCSGNSEASSDKSVEMKDKEVREVRFEEREVIVVTTDDRDIRGDVSRVNVSPLDDTWAGTYVSARVQRGSDYGSGFFGPYRTVNEGDYIELKVRGTKNLESWDQALRSLRDKYYGPRDVLPPTPVGEPAGGPAAK